MKLWLLTLILPFGPLFFSTTKSDLNRQKTENTPLTKANSLENHCDTTALPLVFIHGFLASGDTWEKQALRFIANGICTDRIFMFDWNSLGSGRNPAILNEFIDRVLSKTGAHRVNLVGHSAGGGLSYSYLSNPDHARKVAAYAHLGARPELTPPGSEGEVPTLNIYSEADEIVPGGEISGAGNLKLAKADHYQVATSPEVFEALYEFFYGSKPDLTEPEVHSGEVVRVAGKSLTLGENLPNAGAEIAVYELDAATGFRMEKEAAEVFLVDSSGSWGPVHLRRSVPYEFEVISPQRDGRQIYYYRKPFLTDNSFVYLRALPPLNSMAGMMLSGLPADDDQSAVALFTAEQAVIYDRDDLRIDGIDLSVPEFADAGTAAIAWFLYDHNHNMKTDTIGIPAFAAVPFLNGVDVFFGTEERRTLIAEFNGTEIRFPNRKSGSEGIVVIVFN